MARGKHGESAAVRDAARARDAEIEAYQHNVARLSRENAELKERMKREQSAHTAQVRTLQAAVDEGTSARVIALESELRKARDKADQAHRQQRDRQEQIERMSIRARDYVMAAEGCTSVEAFEVVSVWMGLPPGTVISDIGRGNAQRAIDIERARGLRSKNA